jgi:hypothetical protein
MGSIEGRIFSMANIFLWAFRIVLGAIMFCASVGPKDVDSNISDWLDRFGLKALARSLAGQQVDFTALVVCALLLGLTILLPWWSKHFPARPRHVYDTEVREGIGLAGTPSPGNEYAPTTQAIIEAKAESNRQAAVAATGDHARLAKLIARERRLTLDLERERERLRECGAAVGRYNGAVEEYSSAIVHRPRMRNDRPEVLLDAALEKFVAFDMRDRAWREEFNRPNAAYEEWTDERGDNRREIFNPENNPRYVAKHRENGAHLAEVLAKEENRVRQIEAELRAVGRQIAEQDRPDDEG